MHIHVCLLAFMLYIHDCLSRSRLYYVLCALCGFVLRWLHPSFLGFVWMCPLVSTPSWCQCACFIPFSAPCDVDRLALLALHHPFGFLCFYAFSLHACLHVHAWVYVSSTLQSIEVFDIRSKPTFVLLGHHFLFDNMFVFLFVCFLLGHMCFIC